jgi:hypothetical protein
MKFRSAFVILAALAVPAGAQQSQLAGAPEQGEWRYISSASMSQAVFANGRLTFGCDRASRRISMTSNPPTLGTVSLTTDAGTMAIGGGSDLPAKLSAFDALAFARGKFGVSMSGRTGVTVYPWDSTVARIIEDCRI